MKRISHLNPYRMLRESTGTFNFGRINGYVLLAALITLLLLSTAGNIPQQKEQTSENTKELLTEKPVEPSDTLKNIIQSPQYNGGDMELIKFIAKAAAEVVDYTVTNGIMGRVICQFIVNEDGSLSDIEVIRGLDTYLDKVAVDIIENMPKWIPATQNGKPIQMQYTLPIMFRQHR